MSAQGKARGRSVIFFGTRPPKKQDSVSGFDAYALALYTTALFLARRAAASAPYPAEGARACLNRLQATRPPIFSLKCRKPSYSSSRTTRAG